MSFDSTRPKVLSPLLVCWRYIRYQSDLPLTSRGFSLAFGMSRKCPPELKSGIDRVLDKQTSTRDSSSHTWGAWMSNEGQAPHPSERPSTPRILGDFYTFIYSSRLVTNPEADGY